MQFVFDFEKLEVYKRSTSIMAGIFRLYNRLPQDLKFSVGDQIIRAGLSISNNISEGSGKLTARDKRRFYNMALGSCREVVSILNIMKEENLIDESTYKELREKAIEINNMLKALSKTARDFSSY